MRLHIAFDAAGHIAVRIAPVAPGSPHWPGWTPGGSPPVHAQHFPADAYPPRLLDHYLSHARELPPGGLLAIALRTRSLAARVVLARAAAGASASLDHLVAAARHRAPGRLQASHIDPAALADLARVVALQDILPDDPADGLALYELALDMFGPEAISPDHQGLHAQLALHLGDRARAAALLEIYGRVPDQVSRTLRLDLANPFVTSGVPADIDWLRAFQSLFPEPHPTLTSQGDHSPFDRLAASVEHKIDAAERISVILTSFQPGVGLVTAVRSLIEQSWRNLEILIVDDASPPEHDPVLEHCLRRDERIRLIKLPVNGGTYAARNAGLDAASGPFVTFQDSDDWSHPRRLERQVQPLLADPSLVATTSEGLRVTGDLALTRPGRPQEYLNSSSLMFRRDPVLQRVGYLDGVRKAADTEYLRRLEAAFGPRAVRHLRGELYALLRLSPSSLSRADFRAGWVHPARAAYQSAYSRWHEQIKAGEASPYLPRDLARRPFAVPAHVAGTTTDRARGCRWDVVLACDWRPFGGPQKSMLEEIRALTRRGLRVAVMHMEAYRFMRVQARALCRPIQSLINDGTVGHLLPSDEADVSLLVIRYPPVLQFAAGPPSGLRAKRVIILANAPVSELDGTDWRYVPTACTAVARELFAVEPVWCPQGPAIRAQLEADLARSEIADFDMPGIIDAEEWRVDRTRFRSDRPVIGRHSRDVRGKWPGDRDTLLQVYPNSPEIDVRVMGGTRAVRAVLGTAGLPSNWLAYGYDEVSVRSFLYQIDFFVYFPHAQWVEAFGRAVLEALASGCVAILPHHFARTFGDAAIYCDPPEVRELVQRYYATPELFRRQSRCAQHRVRQLYGHDTYADLISRLTAAS